MTLEKKTRIRAISPENLADRINKLPLKEKLELLNVINKLIDDERQLLEDQLKLITNHQ